MVRSKTYKIISLCLAFLIFFSSSGLTLDIHYCQGEMKRLNLFGTAKSCAEVSQMTKKCCSSISADDICGSNGDHKGCCNNKSFELDLDFDSAEVIANPITDKQLVKAFVLSCFIDVRPSPSLHNYTNYYPPPLKRDIAILFQTFLL